MARMRLAVLPGDGVGPEVTAAALGVVEAVAERYGHTVDRSEAVVGWAAVEVGEPPLPARTETICREADAVVLGAVGDPQADDLPPSRRPERGLLQLRQVLGCYVNLRPVRVSPSLLDASPLRPAVARGTDLLIVRELAGGLYYGEPRSEGGAGRPAVNTLTYGEEEVSRIAHRAFTLARGRRRHVTSVDKANVLEVSRLWRRVVHEVAAEYADVELESMLVDRAALELMLRPSRFDVVLTGNLFGDILSDEAAGIVGSLGLLPSASVGGTTDLYEPVHGSAPDLAGSDRANPMAAIASMGLMMRYTFGLSEEADAVEAAIEAVLESGARTEDVASDPSHERVGTAELGRRVAAAVRGESAVGAGKPEGRRP